MEDDLEAKGLRKLLARRGGPPPGYEWSVVSFPQARDEARKILDLAQFRHIAEQVRELARLPEPTRSESVDVRPVEEMYEIRDSGGELRNLNVRLFFYPDKSCRTLVLLGFFAKKNDGPTRPVDKARMKARLARYRRQTGS